MGSKRLPVVTAVETSLARGAIVVTANQRAARTLRQAFDAQQSAAQRTSWEPPKVLAWDVWTAELWRRRVVEGRETRLLLSYAQEQQIWRGVIEADTEMGGLKTLETVDSLAGMAADAWRLLHAYGGAGRLRGSSFSPDTRAFERWVQAFRRRCRLDQYITRAELETELAAAGQSMGEVLLVGFDRLTPAQAALLEAGARVERYASAVESWDLPRGLWLHAAPEPSAEVHAAACWARRIVEADPLARVAVIVPSVDADRTTLERVFREVLAPELVPITAGNTGGPYEFSLGEPLSQLPMIVVALDLLRWTLHALPIETVGRLLLSPYFGETAERGARAEFDAFELRRAALLRPEVELAEAIRMVAGSRRAERLGALRGQLRSLERTAERLFRAPASRGSADWAEAMRELLKAAGWAASGTNLDSIDFQAWRKWEQTLDELATLDFTGERVSFARAVRTLETLTKATLFAPESREAPVQIMGPLEAAGSEFDAVWFLRADEQSWPMQSSANPLLAWALQRELGMPGADPSADRALARQVTERLAASAGTVVFSYAQAMPELPETRLRASSLVEELGLETMEIGEAPEQTPEETQPIELEAVAEESWVPLADATVRGGAQILKDQAACAFRAFAQHRLSSSELESAAHGLNARERGNLVHVALEEFWTEVESQPRLKSLSEPDRMAALDRAIDAALEDCSKTRLSGAPPAWEQAYLELQRERLRRLLGPWLDQEMARTAPFTVKQREASVTDAAIGPLRLRLRVDRVDSTEAGDVLIDYKTGIAGPNDWLTDRPDEPQLPLYAVLAEGERLAGVAFASIRAGNEMSLSGYAAEEGILPRATRLPEGVATLEEQVVEWQHVLTHLAEEFAQGYAAVQPKEYPATCRHCAQRLLCRVNPASLRVDSEAGEEETNG